MAPASPGLYVIHDSNGEVVYVGSTPLLRGALGLVERGHTSTELSRAIADEAGFALADKEAAARKVRRREFGFRVSWLVVMDRMHLDELTASLRKSMLPRYNA